MTSISELKSWLESLHPDNQVAIDDGGLNLVEIDPSGAETGERYELGGAPPCARLLAMLVTGNHTYRRALSVSDGGHFIPNDDHPEVGIGQVVVVEFDPADQFAHIVEVP